MITAKEAQEITEANSKSEIDRLRESFTHIVRLAAESGENKAYFTSVHNYAAKQEFLSNIKSLGYRTSGWIRGVSHRLDEITVYWGE